MKENHQDLTTTGMPPGQQGPKALPVPGHLALQAPLQKYGCFWPPLAGAPSPVRAKLVLEK